VSEGERLENRGELSQEDLTALRDSNRDVSDLDRATVARAHEGFRYAYSVAQGVLDGSLDPLSI
jgi:hypothetical protein